MSAHYRYILIGADAAGNSAAGQIRRLDKEGSMAILEKGETIAYGACGIPYTASGVIEDVESLVHFTAESFGSRVHADVLLKHEVTAVDFSAKKLSVQTPDGEKEFIYEKLLIGTGASPIRLPFIDYSHERVFEMKTIPDARALKTFLEQQKPEKAAIIGSGYIGLEAAENLQQAGIEVTIYEALERPMPRLDKHHSGEIEKLLEKHGVHLHTSTAIQSVTSDANGVIVSAEGKEEKYDFLLSAVGVKPATAFLSESSITLEKGAVLANAQGETSLPDVYAAGDCALVPHKVTGKPVYMPLGHTANKMGRIAGMNMGGKKTGFPGIVGTQVFKLFDTAFAVTGLSEEEAREAGYDVATTTLSRPGKAGYYPGAGKVFLKMVADKKEGILIGVSLHGPLESYGLIDAAAALIDQRAKLDEIAWMDFAYAPPFAPVWNALVSAAGKLVE